MDTKSKIAKNYRSTMSVVEKRVEVAAKPITPVVRRVK